LPEREAVLRRLVSAVRPGGWVMIEDVDVDGPMAEALARYAYPAEDIPLTARVFRGMHTLFAARGADAGFGARLPGALREAGLEDVRAEVHAPLAPGGAGGWMALTVGQLRSHLVRTGTLTEDDAARFLELCTQPGGHCLPPLMVTAWGRRPVG